MTGTDLLRDMVRMKLCEALVRLGPPTHVVAVDLAVVVAPTNRHWTGRPERSPRYSGAEAIIFRQLAAQDSYACKARASDS